jgi:hypothetical protein
MVSFAHRHHHHHHYAANVSAEAWRSEIQRTYKDQKARRLKKSAGFLFYGMLQQ